MTKHTRLQFLAAFLVVYLLACTESAPGKSTTPTPDPTDPTESGKTYLKVTNNTSYAVNVYINDPPLYGDQAPEVVKTVQSRGSNQWELQPTAEGSNGETLYFEYLIPIGELTIPFYTNTAASTRLVKLEADKVNTSSVPDLPPIDTDSSFVLIRNGSDDNIWLQQGIGTIYPFGASVREIRTDSAAVYVFKNVSSLSGWTIGDTGTRKDFPSTTLQRGLVYTFFYDRQNGPQLFLQEPFDPNMNDKIWSIPTSSETGTYFTVGLLQSRINVETDGYILVGRTSYNEDVVTQPQAGALPYFAAIAPNGDVAERKIILSANPSALNLRRFIDEGTELVFTGQAYYESTDGTPFILGTDYTGEPLFYLDSFFDEIDASVESKYANYIAKDKRGYYAIGGDFYNFDTKLNQVYLDKVRRTDFDAVEYERLWIQPSADVQPSADDGYSYMLYLAYDGDADAYIVVAEDSANNGSLLYIIDAVDGSQKPVIRLANHTINKVFQIGADYYAAGTYLGVSKYRGFIRKLNIGSGAWDGNPMFVDSKYPDGATMIYNIVQDRDGALVLSGACVEEAANQDERTTDMPWMVKYDLDNRTKKWERVYEDYEGYHIYSASPSSLGSYLLELYNGMTYQSTLISTDLLGNIGDQEKAPIPRGRTFTVDPPGSPGVSAVVVPLEDAEMQEPETLILAKGQSAVIQVKGSWESYAWYVDGSPVGTTPAYTFTTTVREPGVWTVMVVVTSADGAKRSAWRRVRIEN
ncbi:MAG: hypothetical protein LBH75_04850 [Treponema sp.]|jgi:hypothetical protein|nr:hypothetical protein [Treponema sp.]